MPRPTFAECLMAAARNREFVEHYDRLRGTNLGRRGSPIELEIDRATGKLESELAQFVADVYDLIYLRIKPD